MTIKKIVCHYSKEHDYYNVEYFELKTKKRLQEYATELQRDMCNDYKIYDALAKDCKKYIWDCECSSGNPNYFDITHNVERKLHQAGIWQSDIKRIISKTKKDFEFIYCEVNYIHPELIGKGWFNPQGELTI